MAPVVGEALEPGLDVRDKGGGFAVLEVGEEPFGFVVAFGGAAEPDAVAADDDELGGARHVGLRSTGASRRLRLVGTDRVMWGWCCGLRVVVFTLHVLRHDRLTDEREAWQTRHELPR